MPQEFKCYKQFWHLKLLHLCIYPIPTKLIVKQLKEYTQIYSLKSSQKSRKREVSLSKNLSEVSSCCIVAIYTILLFIHICYMVCADKATHERKKHRVQNMTYYKNQRSILCEDIRPQHVCKRIEACGN